MSPLFFRHHVYILAVSGMKMKNLHISYCLVFTILPNTDINKRLGGNVAFKGYSLPIIMTTAVILSSVLGRGGKTISRCPRTLAMNILLDLPGLASHVYIETKYNNIFETFFICVLEI